MKGHKGVYKRCSCRNPVDGRRLGAVCPRLVERGHGTWQFVIELPASRDGSRQRLRRGGFRSRAAALQARAYLMGADVNHDRSLLTVGQWLDLWLVMRQSLSFSTRRIYAQHIRDYLKPYLGGVPLRDLSIGRVQAMFTSLLRLNGAGGRPLSAATLQKIRGALRAALNAAIRRGLISDNPARWVELPSGKRPRAVVWTEPRVAHWRATGERPPVAVWTVAQTAQFLRHIRGHQLYVLFHLIALLGLRRGEALGLRWCDIDLTAQVLMVSHQVRDQNGQTVVCPPKTDASVRMIALDHFTVNVLRWLRATQQQVAGGTGPTGFLFVNPHGEPLSPGYLTHAFRRLITEADLPPIRLHDLRHGAASLSLAAGNELKAVQDMLGHDSIVLTADTYTSVLPCLAHNAAEATAALVMRAAHQTSQTIRRRSHRQRRRTRRQTPRRSTSVTEAQ